MLHTIKYPIGRFQIRVNIWYLIVFLLLQTLLNELGFWQLERAQQKQVRLLQLEKGGQLPETSLAFLDEAKIAQFQLVDLKVETGYGPILLLDNKINKKRTGYHVLHIVRDKPSGKYLLLNRGWIYAGSQRMQVPQFDQLPFDWSINARVYPLIESAISTNAAKIEKLGEYFRLPVLDLELKQQIEKLSGFILEDYILRLNAETEFALDIDWKWINMSPEKHLGYAFQWFALALALLILSLIVSIKKR